MCLRLVSSLSLKISGARTIAFGLPTMPPPPTSDSNTFSRQLNRDCAGRISGKKRRKGEQSLNGYDGIGLRPHTESGPFLDNIEGGDRQ